MNGTAIAISTCVLACIVTCVWIWYMAWKDGYDAGRDYESSRQYWKMLRERNEADNRAKVTYGGADGAPPWYVTVEPRRSRVAVPGITMASLAPTTPISNRRATDTGELRALAAATDLYVDRITADGDAYRAEMNA